MYLTPPVYPPPPHDDPDFPRAAGWLAGRPGAGPIARVVGVPFSALSISKAQCQRLPHELRAALWSFSTYLPDRGVDLRECSVEDVGDVDLESLEPEKALRRIEEACAAFRDGPPVALIGGDNSITAPAMLGLVGAGGSLLTIDAHHDVRTGVSNGSPVRVLIDAGVDGSRIRQIGISDLANSRVYAEWARERGIGWVSASALGRTGMSRAVRRALDELRAPIYVDVDVDAVDRAFAPGAPGAQPGGIRPGDLAEAAFICGGHDGVRALDIVEVDPSRDVAGVTVRLAAMVLLHFLAGVATR